MNVNLLNSYQTSFDQHVYIPFEEFSLIFICEMFELFGKLCHN